MATYNVAVIFKNPQNDDVFILVKQDRPSKFDDEEYDSFVDSDIWDLPSAKLEARDALDPTGIVIEGLESASDKLDSRNFDFNSAIIKVVERLGLEERDVESWKLSKVVEEAEFGPGFVHTLYISATLVTGDLALSGLCRWMSVKDCLSQLLNVKPGSDRVGPLVVVGLLNDSVHLSRKIQTSLRHQEYPPGVILVPMKSRTGKPFHTTNLIVFAPENASNEYDEDRFVACGDALVVDPGCLPECHNEVLVPGAYPDSIPMGIPIPDLQGPPTALVSGVARRSSRSFAASTAEVRETEAGPSGAQAGPSSAMSGAAGSSSSVFASPQYWISDRIPVASEHASTYVVPERDPTLYAPFPRGAGPIPEDWAAHTYIMARRLEGALMIARTVLAYQEEQDATDLPPRRRRPPFWRR